MDCRKAQAQLNLMARGKDAAKGGEIIAAQRHLNECADCRVAVEASQQFDAQIARAMSDVPVPSGLADRLRAVVQASETTPAEPGLARSSSAGATPATAPVSLKSQRRIAGRIFSGAAVALLLALTLKWAMPYQTVLNGASVNTLAACDLNLLPADSRAPFDLPSGWNSGRFIQFGDSSRLASVDRTEVPVLPFLLRADRRLSHVTGFLVRLPDTQWHAALNAGRFSSAEIQYAQFGSWVAWREGNVVFICVVRGDANVMQRLQDLIDGNRDLT